MITFDHMTFRYASGTKNALDDLTLTIPEGDFVGIIGASGAGKSTLLYAACGLIPHHYAGDFYGAVRTNGMDTVDTPLETLSSAAGMVFQDVDSQMVASTVEDEILFGLENFGVPRDQIEERLLWALHKTGIAPLRDRMLSTLSGGQKQKVAVASILALQPKILLLDEPTGELDPASSEKLFSLLRELNRQGVTIGVVEQKIMLLCAYCKTLCVMSEGKICRRGPVKEVLRDAAVLEAEGVHVPRIVSLSQLLRSRRLYDGPPPVCLEEAAEMVETVRSDAGQCRSYGEVCRNDPV